MERTIFDLLSAQLVRLAFEPHLFHGLRRAEKWVLLPVQSPEKAVDELSAPRRLVLDVEIEDLGWQWFTPVAGVVRREFVWSQGVFILDRFFVWLRCHAMNPLDHPFQPFGEHFLLGLWCNVLYHVRCMESSSERAIVGLPILVRVEPSPPQQL